MAGVAVYSLVPVAGATHGPDWALGLLMGLGGMAGMYLGARARKHVPGRLLKGLLAAALLFISTRRIAGYFLMQLVLSHHFPAATSRPLYKPPDVC